jgi:hypothetical protein
VERAWLDLWQQDGFRPDGNDAFHVVTELRVPYEVPVTGPGSYAITAHIQVSPATWETTGRILLGRSGKRARGVEQVAGQPPYAGGGLHQRVARKVEARSDDGVTSGQVMWNSILRNCMRRQKGPAKQPPGCERRS